MAFDGFILNAVTTELKNSILSGRVQKIYEPNPNEILLSIYANGLQYALCMNVSSNNYSIHLTTSKKENPLAAPNFCMLLRKYLINFKVTNITTFGFERIAMFEFSGNNESHEPVTRKLVVELMGKHSNILLLDEENKIIDSLKHFSKENGSYRNIMPKFEYEFPVSDKKDIRKTSESEMRQLFDSIQPTETSLTDFFVAHYTGVSKTLLQSIIAQCKIDNTLNLQNCNLVLQALLQLADAISMQQVKCIFIGEDYALTCHFEKNVEGSFNNNGFNEELNKITMNTKNKKEINNTPFPVNFFLDDYYTNKEEKEQFVSFRNQILNFILAKSKKLSKKLMGIDEKLKECANMKTYQLYGELLTSFLYQISNEHISEITLENYCEENAPITIPLDISISPSENAKKYFKKYHKLKNTYTIVQEQKQELEQEISYLESIIYEIQSAKTISDLNTIYEEIETSFQKKQNGNTKNLKNKKMGFGLKNANLKHDNFRQKQLNPKIKKKQNGKGLSSSEILQLQVDGFQILVGRNNNQNDELTFKIAKKEDIWFHVKDLHGSHVVLITNGKNPSQETINRVASIAAYYSKASQSSNVPVDYTLIKYVKKPSNSKPGMVIFTNQKTVNVQPLIP